MSEYVLFEETQCHRFLQFVASCGLEGNARPDPIGGFVVTLPDNIGDALEAAIDDEYEVLMQEQRNLLDSENDDGSRNVMSVSVTLPENQQCIVRLPFRYARRLYEHFSIEEIHELVSAIAQSAINSADGPACRRM